MKVSELLITRGYFPSKNSFNINRLFSFEKLRKNDVGPTFFKKSWVDKENFTEVILSKTLLSQL